jgi:thioredoxin 1
MDGRKATDAGPNRPESIALQLFLLPLRFMGARKDDLPSMSALPDVTEKTFKQDVLENDQPVLVDFWAPWCGPCKMLAPVIEKVAQSYAGRAKFMKLNTDVSPQIAGEYQVSGIPCLILFKGGKAVDRIVGFVPEKSIQALLDKHLAVA